MTHILKLTSVALLSVGAVSLASAQTALVDFGSSNAAGTIGGNYFNVWNPGNNVDLLNTGGVVDTGWNLDSTSGGATNDGITPDFTPSFNGAPNPFNDDSITGDALNLTPIQGTRNVRFYNLAATTSYTFTIFGARDSTQTRVTSYSLINDAAGSALDSGTITTSGTGVGTGSNYNNDTVLVLTGTTDADGEIFVQYTATTGDFGYLNAISITQVPEPSTYALFAGLLALTSIAVRRRRA